MHQVCALKTNHKHLKSNCANRAILLYCLAYYFTVILLDALC